MTFEEFLKVHGVSPEGGLCLTVVTDGVKSDSNLLGIGVCDILDRDSHRFLFVEGGDASATEEYTGLEQEEYAKKAVPPDDDFPSKVQEFLLEGQFLVGYRTDFLWRFLNRLPVFGSGQAPPLLDLTLLWSMQELNATFPANLQGRDNPLQILQNRLYRFVKTNGKPVSYKHLQKTLLNPEAYDQEPTYVRQLLLLRDLYRLSLQTDF